ncbi:MAG: hypothetical protein HY427_01575 [Candidatus Levybacteria bacterium]|nr:hypothetical protein [Candidatus Levybacteria bacterium]
MSIAEKLRRSSPDQLFWRASSRMQKEAMGPPYNPGSIRNAYARLEEITVEELGASGNPDAIILRYSILAVHAGTALSMAENNRDSETAGEFRAIFEELRGAIGGLGKPLESMRARMEQRQQSQA